MMKQEHDHESPYEMGTHAARSILQETPPALKITAGLSLVLACVCSARAAVGIQMTVFMVILAVTAGGLPAARFLKLLAIPCSFLLLGGLALVLEYGSDLQGIFRIPAGGGYLYITEVSIRQALLVTSRALGSVSVLLLLGAVTTMAELTKTLEKLHCPGLICGLMYLMYRYIFVMSETHRRMQQAAKSRMGYVDFGRSLATTGKIYGNLLAVSYRQAGKNFDAMESRGYEGEIRFLTRERVWNAKITGITVALAAAEWAFCLLYR